MGLFDGADEERRARDDYAHMRYLEIDRPHCGRQRVEQCANGKMGCEKCHREPAANDYNYVHLSLYRQSAEGARPMADHPVPNRRRDSRARPRDW